MATTIFSSSLALFLLLLLAATTTTLPRSNADAAFLEKTCKSTDAFEFCMSTLKSVPRSIDATTLEDLTHIILDITLADVNNLEAYITQLADKNPGTKLEENLHYCLKLYGSAIDGLNDANKAVSSKDYKGAVDSVNLAGAVPDRCQAAFDDDVPSPITDRNKKVLDDSRLSWQFIVDLLPGQIKF